LANWSPRKEAITAVAVTYAILFGSAMLGRWQWLAYAGFLYVPVAIAWLRGIDFATYGLFPGEWRKTLRETVLPTAAILVPFALGYWFLANHSPLPLPWYPEFAGTPAELLSFAVSQLLVVGIAEEFFYRGYLQQQLDRVWMPRWRILGATLGPAWLVSCAFFAVGHLADGFNPIRLLTFFPGLWYGWMRARAGNIYPGVFAHAASNLLIAYLQGQSLGGN
jgi:membrane protease YdiL (CAAX protease family)